MRLRLGSAKAPTPSCAAPGVTFCWKNSLLRLEQDERNLEGEVVLQLGADVLVRALGVTRDALEVRLDLGVVVDLEVIGLVGVPVELVVADRVLPVVRDVAGLRLGKRCGDDERQHGEDSQGHGRQGLPLRAGAHRPLSFVHLTDPETNAANEMTSRGGNRPPLASLAARAKFDPPGFVLYCGRAGAVPATTPREYPGPPGGSPQ